jgi:hypothetical protein
MARVAGQSIFVITINYFINAYRTMACSFAMTAVVTRCTERAQVGGVEGPVGCHGQGFYMVDAGISLTTHVSVAAHAAITIPMKDVLTQHAPCFACIKSSHC